MNHKDNRRVKLTKQLLKDSLCELLEQESIHEISVRTLCENADINRSTFYKYYDSLYDLIKEMEDDFLEEIEKSLSVDNAEPTNRLAQPEFSKTSAVSSFYHAKYERTHFCYR